MKLEGLAGKEDRRKERVVGDLQTKCRSPVKNYELADWEGVLGFRKLIYYMVMQIMVWKLTDKTNFRVKSKL